jgi:hypothetical protein
MATFSLLLNKFSVLPNAMEDDRFAAFIFCLKNIKICKYVTGKFFFQKIIGKQYEYCN